MDRHSIGDGRLAATITADGAELCSVAAFGQEWLWQAGPAWPRHAPVLFPIVGRLKEDRLRHRGRQYRLTQHGFARDRRFAWAEATATSCRLLLADDEATRALYPFAFRLEVAFAVAGGRLSVAFTLSNPGAETLPASLGAHPAFRWPLADGVAAEAHLLTFARPEPAPIRRLAGGLLRPERFPSPVEGRVLRLHPGLFAEDAIIFDQLASRSAVFSAPGGPALEVAWEGMPYLGLWQRPGAAFLCIEPWAGFASPVDFDGEFADKPGLLLIPPGESRSLRHEIAVRV